MTENIIYHSYNSYDDIEVWYGDRDKGKFIIGTRSEKEADKVVDELNTLLSENIELKKENKELQNENEQLKQQNKMLRTNVGKLTDDVKYLRNLPSTHQKENKQLKQQLFCVAEGEGICLICEHHYLVIKPNDKYFISKCRKEHEECSKEAVRYCEDFELMVKE